MHLVGSTFHCEVPDGWQEVRELGCVIATAPTPLLGFTPNVVLRESVIKQRPDALAAISQATLSATAELPGALVLQVEAVERDGVEHRRIWMLTPVTPEELHGNILSLLSVQDLVVTDGVIAELTLTVPFIEWSPNNQHQKIIDSLQALPLGKRATPPTTATVPEVALDEWATARDGAPREDLSVVSSPGLILQAEPLVLSDEAAKVFFTHAGQRVFTPVTGQVKDELAAAGLVEQDGSPSGAGFWYIDHLLSGTGWTVTVAAPKPWKLRFWVTNSTTIFTAANPEQTGTSLLFYCPSNDLFRILLGWVGTAPAWPLDVQLELRPEQLQVKLERDQVTFTPDGDAAEFASQPWTLLSLASSREETLLNWIHTPKRGAATTWYESSLRNPDDLISVRQHDDAALWLQLTATIAENSEETP
ncbi:MAG: hypothetical protein Q4D96_01535 [Propionibacteriaceae bacterium]|nr:hypothetical protein [Propionibacteriaceae bacterium]